MNNLTKQQFEKLREEQNLSDLHYPSAKEWMWNYCLFLGKFTDTKGRHFDLGVHYNGPGWYCLFNEATVFGNESGMYSSGDLDMFMIPNSIDGKENIEKRTMLWLYIERGFEAKVECWNRLQELVNKSPSSHINHINTSVKGGIKQGQIVSIKSLKQ